MVTPTKILPGESSARSAKQPTPRGRARTIAIGIGVAVVALSIGYTPFMNQAITTRLFTTPSTTAQPGATAADASSKPAKTEIRLTREGIDHLLDTIDQAIRRKDVDTILRHIAPDANITIHMKQGAQQQIATLTREEYRKTLTMGFAFPSANDYARVSTTVSLAPDERSAKVSFKSTETLRQAHRDLKIEGEETLVFRIRDDKPVITSLEQVVPGDST
jgi:hypothetical protein